MAAAKSKSELGEYYKALIARGKKPIVAITALMRKIIVIANPRVAATGHRICNDCSNACIYQKQEPVDIPLVESNILETTLLLPYGVEIYLLLTNWNPLNIFALMPKPPTNYKVLVVGQGPAGFSLSYYLLRDGHTV